LSSRTSEQRLSHPFPGDSGVIGQDLLLRALRKSLGFVPGRLALFYLATGFASLSLFYVLLWELGSPLMQRRGLLSYYSATLGDGLLIPFGIAVSASCLRSISELVNRSLKANDADLRHRAQELAARFRGRALGWIPGGLALATTVAVHVMWLSNPRIQANWTIEPGHLNFFGWWHAIFFFFVLWWYFAFLARLALVSLSLLRRSLPSSLASAPLEIWSELNALMAVAVGFAALLYIDNYRLQFNWRTLLTSVTTLSYLLFTLVVLITINLYFALAVYRPTRKRISREELRSVDLLARRAWIAFAFGSVLAASFFLLGIAVAASHGWTVAAVVAGLVMPFLFAENYTADLFWNYGWSPDPVDSLGICLVWFASSVGLLFTTAVTLGGIHVETMNEMLSAWVRGLPISVIPLVFCLCVAWTASFATEGTLRMAQREEQLQELSRLDPPMDNILRNFLLFWCLFEFLVIPISIFVYHRESVVGADRTSTVEGVFGVIAAVVIVPLYNNHSHLNSLRSSPHPPSSYRAISRHISFLSIYVGALVLFVWGWLAFSYSGPVH